MREIRFRYYDQFNGCFGWSRNFKNLAEFFSNYQMAVDGENNPILEQYTGLNDKNGVEIYAGDIVIATSNNLEFKGYVKYAAEIAAYWLHNNKGSMDFLSAFQKFEIIGNIHQNPKLLEGK